MAKKATKAIDGDDKLKAEPNAKQQRRVKFEGVKPERYAKVLEIVAKQFPDLAKCIAQLKVFGWTSFIILLQVVENIKKTHSDWISQERYWEL